MSHTRLGLIFVSVAVIFWGILPIALKLSGGFIDPVSLTWFRFLVAFMVTYFLQWRFGALRQFVDLSQGDWLRLSTAGILLMCNYTSFVYSLDYLSPGTAQLNFQTAPFYLAFGGALFFKERLTALQLTCFATLALGVLLFFHPSLDVSASNASQIGFGVLIVQFSVLSWTSYALLQKSLITKLSPNNVLLFIYGLGVLLMAPLSDFSQFKSMTNHQWLVIVFCAANTLIAYGCFGQAMKYWPTAQVSAMLALTPVLSFTANAVVVELGLWPNIFRADAIDIWSLLGIILIVGSVFVVQIWPLYQQKRLKSSKAFED
ncbi:DMT family transporter [Shewanella sp. KT0246]|uniref:DMT family transporter n=1 Tax=Shewanella sp. KT0246 TaxID=2815912 RepID=UPI001BC30D81|nr:DMT family transporter [Shewanella sp. KT0246]GIU52575.1 10 TMS drug/metabolite efflux pump (DME) family protein [Shewanella sp. KT0246]